MKSFAIKKRLFEGRDPNPNIEDNYSEIQELIKKYNAFDWKKILRQIHRKKCQKGTYTIQVTRHGESFDVDLDTYDYKLMLRLVTQAIYQSKPSVLKYPQILWYKMDDEYEEQFLIIYNSQTDEEYVCVSMNKYHRFLESLKHSTDKIYIIFEIMINHLLTKEFQFTEDELKLFTAALDKFEDL